MAGIIKASGPNAGRVVSGSLFNFDDVSTKANNYLEQVKRDAALVVQKAKEDAEQIRAKAEEQGRQAGLQSAEQSMRQKVQQSVQQAVQQEMTGAIPLLQKTVDAVHQAREEWLGEWEKNVVRLATAIAEKIIRRELAHQPEIAMKLVRETLELAAGCKQLRLHLNPRDCDMFGDPIKQMANQINKLGETEIVKDAAIGPGGCKLTTEFGEVDNQLDSQLRRIAEELL